MNQILEGEGSFNAQIEDNQSTISNDSIPKGKLFDIPCNYVLLDNDVYVCVIVLYLYGYQNDSVK